MKKAPEMKKAPDQTPRVRRRYRIQVTAEDIAKAIPKDSNVCAVARAIARTIPDAKSIAVDMRTIRFSRNQRRLVYLTPTNVAQYVVDFDGGRPLEPFEFSIDESRMIPLKHSRLTDLGRQRDRVADKAGRKAAQTAKTRNQNPQHAYRMARRKARQDFQAAHRELGPTRTRTPGERDGRGFPRVLPSKYRAYGHRDLPINRNYEADIQAAEERGRASASTQAPRD
jgi:hypothetical protein